MRRMTTLNIVFLATLVLLGAGLGLQGFPQVAAGSAAAFPEVETHLYAGGFTSPVGITHAGDGSGRLFVVEQGGTIRIVRDGSAQTEAFLDISGQVLFSGEQGLLSAAFPPGYAQKGYFYVYYTRPDGNNQVSRFHLTADSDRADAASEEPILLLEHPTYSNHNGGQMAFGPDGYLYIGTGDGGGGGDPAENAQSLGALLGKILRLDVEAGISPYAVPSSNPFASTAGARAEIWALGLRNPWRFAFDRTTGDLYIGDVGQGLREEVDFQPASSSGGENYGWDNLEGSLCYEPKTGCTEPDGYVPPVTEYDHGTDDSIGCSITGGVMYRGAAYPGMQGIYFYGDFCTGRLWGLRQEGGAWASQELTQLPVRISSFGEDEAGEIYLAGYGDGNLYRLAPASPALAPAIYLPLIFQ